MLFPKALIISTWIRILEVKKKGTQKSYILSHFIVQCEVSQNLKTLIRSNFCSMSSIDKFKWFIIFLEWYSLEINNNIFYIHSLNLVILEKDISIQEIVCGGNRNQSVPIQNEELGKQPNEALKKTKFRSNSYERLSNWGLSLKIEITILG